MNTFKNELFEVYAEFEDGNILFDAESVAKSLGITDNKNGNKYVRWNRVNSYLPANSPQVAKGSLIPESLVYKLAFKANNEVAEKFQDWLAIDVIPSIRKNGFYGVQEKKLPQNYKEALLHLVEQVEKTEKLEEQLQLQAPKVVVADAITASSNSILIRDLAKILAQNGAVNVGEKRLFTWMRNNGYLTQKNVPTQRSIEMGIMEMHERPVVMKDNQIKTYITPRISGKGQAYFIKKFLYI